VTKLQDKEDTGKLGDLELQEAKCRTDVVTYSLMAEAQHFHQHRVADFRDYIQTYLNAQIEFHKMVTCVLLIFYILVVNVFSILWLLAGRSVPRLNDNRSGYVFSLNFLAIMSYLL